MTVETTESSINYTGDGATTVYPFNFRCDVSSWMTVAIGSVVQSPSLYIVNLNADQDVSPGGDVTFNTAPLLNASILLLRVVPLTQDTDYTPYDAFPAERNESDLDKLTMICQQLQSDIDALTNSADGQEETITLSAGQTVVPFSNDLTASSIYINTTDGSADRGRLLINNNYTVDYTTNTVTLVSSYPDGTLLTALTNATQSFNRSGLATGAVWLSGFPATQNGCTGTNTSDGGNGRIMTITLGFEAKGVDTLALVSSSAGLGGAPLVSGVGLQTSLTEISYNIVRADGTLLGATDFNTSFTIVDMGA